MRYIPSTAEIVAFKMLGKSVDEHWVKWAYDMLLAGFETQELIILAGEHAPFNQFELQRLTDKIFIGLDLTFENKKVAYSNYACYLLYRSLAGKSRPEAVLRKLSELYTEEYEDLFQDFYLLYWAQYDLQYSYIQYYWYGATRSNIHQIISEYFATCLVHNCV